MRDLVRANSELLLKSVICCDLRRWARRGHWTLTLSTVPDLASSFSDGSSLAGAASLRPFLCREMQKRKEVGLSANMEQARRPSHMERAHGPNIVLSLAPFAAIQRLVLFFGELSFLAMFKARGAWRM